MIKKIISISIFLFSLYLGGAARAQFVVSDPAAEASDVTIAVETAAVDAEMGTADTLLGEIAQATQGTETILGTPSIVTGMANGLDGGAAANATAQTAEIIPGLSGASSVSVTATELTTQAATGVTTAETEGLLTGNPADTQAQRQQKIAANIQGMAVDDLKMAVARFDAADLMEAKLDMSPNIKTATSLNGLLLLQVFKAVTLLQKTTSLAVVAQSQALLDQNARFERYKQDHNDAADGFVVVP